MGTWTDDVEARLWEEWEKAWAEGEALIDEYKAKFAKKRKDLPYSERGNLNVRGMRRTWVMTIEWSYLRTYSGEGREARTFRKSLARGKGWAYPASSFKAAKIWERGLALEFEAKAGPLRKTMAELRVVQMALGRLTRPPFRTAAGLAAEEQEAS